MRQRKRPLDGVETRNLLMVTLSVKTKQGDMLSPERSERVIGFARLVGQLELMIQDAGDSTDFDVWTWMAQWLTEPLPALGGARPTDLVDTVEGLALVSAALAKMQSGAYA